MTARNMALALALLLSGCALVPPWVAYVSLGMDGASYLTTGKGAADHAVSEVLDKDCVLWRFIKGQEICRRSPDLGG